MNIRQTLMAKFNEPPKPIIDSPDESISDLLNESNYEH